MCRTGLHNALCRSLGLSAEAGLSAVFFFFGTPPKHAAKPRLPLSTSSPEEGGVRVGFGAGLTWADVRG